MIAVTPVRLGSSRLLGKNVRSLCGKPLLEFAIETYKKVATVNVFCTEDVVPYLPKGVGWIDEGENKKGNDGGWATKLTC